MRRRARADGGMSASAAEDARGRQKTLAVSLWMRWGRFRSVGGGLSRACLVVSVAVEVTGGVIRPKGSEGSGDRCTRTPTRALGVTSSSCIAATRAPPPTAIGTRKSRSLTLIAHAALVGGVAAAAVGGVAAAAVGVICAEPERAAYAPEDDAPRRERGARQQRRPLGGDHRDRARERHTDEAIEKVRGARAATAVWCAVACFAPISVPRTARAVCERRGVEEEKYAGLGDDDDGGGERPQAASQMPARRSRAASQV